MRLHALTQNGQQFINYKCKNDNKIVYEATCTDTKRLVVCNIIKIYKVIKIIIKINRL